MKHPIALTTFLVVMFLVSQIVGLAIVHQYIDQEASAASGEIVYEELPFGVERPELDASTSFIFILLAVLIGTGALLLLIKFRLNKFWKVWYFLSVLATLAFAFAAYITQGIAFFLALAGALWKIIKPNIFIHNLTEVFIYGGLAAIFVPILNIFSAIMLLIGISLYDFYAVWKSKHMVSLAQFQAESNLFAGLYIPYKAPKGKPVKLTKKKGPSHTAILGGGDIGFPLLFAGVVMKDFGFASTLVIAITATIALAALFAYSKQGKFYPAMPFLTVGCLVGYGILLLVQ